MRRVAQWGVFLIGVALTAFVIMIFAYQPVRVGPDDPRLTIRQEVDYIDDCLRLGGQPWADDGGYLHCQPAPPVISEVA